MTTSLSLLVVGCDRKRTVAVRLLGLAASGHSQAFVFAGGGTRDTLGLPFERRSVRTEYGRRRRRTLGSQLLAARLGEKRDPEIWREIKKMARQIDNA